MSEMHENTQEQAGTAENTQASADSKNAEKGKQEQLTVPKSRLDEVIAERNALKAEMAAAEEAKRKAEEAKKLEQGKYQELYEKAQAEAAQAAAELTLLQTNALKRDVAQKKGYPALWEYINGTSEEELEADLARLVEAFPAPKTPNINAGTGSGARSGEKTEKMSAAKKRELAALLGVNPDYLPDTPINII